MRTEDEHIGRGRLGRNDERVLGHVARAVDLAVMVDLDPDVHLGTDAPESAQLACARRGESSYYSKKGFHL